MKLKTKLIIIFITFVTLPLISISIFNYKITSNALSKETLSNLRLVADGKKNEILEYL